MDAEILVMSSVRPDGLDQLRARVRVAQRELNALRREVSALPKGSDSRLSAALEMTHARTRVECYQEAWMIMTGRPCE